MPNLSLVNLSLPKPNGHYQKSARPVWCKINLSISQYPSIFISIFLSIYLSLCLSVIKVEKRTYEKGELNGPAVISWNSGDSFEFSYVGGKMEVDFFTCTITGIQLYKEDNL